MNSSGFCYYYWFIWTCWSKPMKAAVACEANPGSPGVFCVLGSVFSPAGSSLLWSGDALLFTACLRCYSCAADWSYVSALIGSSYPGSASGMRLGRRQKIARRGHQIKSVWWNWSDFSFYRAAAAAAAPRPAWPGPPASLPVGSRSRIARPHTYRILSRNYVKNKGHGFLSWLSLFMSITTHLIIDFLISTFNA